MSRRSPSNNPQPRDPHRARAGARPVRALLLAPILALVGSSPAWAQRPARAPEAERSGDSLPPSPARWGWLYRFVGDSADRLRLAQLRGAPTAGFLVRSPSSMTPPVGGVGRGAAWRPLAPSAALVANTAVPVSMN